MPQIAISSYNDLSETRNMSKISDSETYGADLAWSSSVQSFHVLLDKLMIEVR